MSEQVDPTRPRLVRLAVSPLANLYYRYLAPYRTSMYTRPSTLERLMWDPIPYVGWYLFRILNGLHPGSTRRYSTSHNQDGRPRGRPVRVVCLSDTHNMVPSDVPDGDLLIHAGDMSRKGTYEELRLQFAWLASLPHRHKVAIAGNHDTWLDRACRRQMREAAAAAAVETASQVGLSPGPEQEPTAVPLLDLGHPTLANSGSPITLDSLASSIKSTSSDSAVQYVSKLGLRPRSGSGSTVDSTDVIYLQHRTVELVFPEHDNRRLLVHGAPQSPTPDQPVLAFQYHQGTDAWSNTLSGREIDILVTHTPPLGYLDLANPFLGCRWLRNEAWRVRPAMHVFGHIHAGAGQVTVRWDDLQRRWDAIVDRSDLRHRLGYGFIRAGWLDLAGWFGLVRLVSYGITGLIWTWVWGGEARPTVMVNAALKDGRRLRNKITVVDLYD